MISDKLVTVEIPSHYALTVLSSWLCSSLCQGQDEAELLLKQEKRGACNNTVDGTPYYCHIKCTVMYVRVLELSCHDHCRHI